MVTHMKTTLEISDNLSRRTKKLAQREGETFKSIVTRFEVREKAAVPYLLDIPIVSGEVAPEFLNVPWDRIRDEIHGYPFNPASDAVLPKSDAPLPTKKFTKKVVILRQSRK